MGVMAGFWPLRPRSLHAGFWAGKRVMVSVSRQNLQLKAFMSQALYAKYETILEHL
ncbi:hypothetical protein N577_004355 [Lacticaseibacillus rhamnosus 2166]|nr:hypothetical protein N577_004355 [Lacticaseibacillus rhamnosus 2166]